MPTQEQIDQIAKEIENMDHETMCHKWRFSEAGSIYFRKDLKTSSGKSLGDLFSSRLFDYFGGFNSQISKKIGWINGTIS